MHVRGLLKAASRFSAALNGPIWGVCRASVAPPALQTAEEPRRSGQAPPVEQPSRLGPRLASTDQPAYDVAEKKGGETAAACTRGAAHKAAYGGAGSVGIAC